MTEQEAAKIRSAFCNGYEYSFGGSFFENCDTDEVERHALLLDEAIKKQVPKTIIDTSNEFNTVLSYPNCKQLLVNMRHKSNYKSKYCHRCGQALKQEG